MPRALSTPALPTPRWVYLVVLSVAGLALSSTLLSWWQARREAQRELESYFDFRVREATHHIEQRMSAYHEVLRGAHGFVSSAPVTRATFARYVAVLRLEQSFPGIQGVGLSIVVPPADRDRHHAEARAQGFPDYQIRPAGVRDRYTTIYYLEPFSGRNLRAFGYDMYSEPVRREAMDRACDRDEMALSGKVRLVQETDDQPQAGFLMYVPVFNIGAKDHDARFNDAASRRANIAGWVYAPFRMNDLMAGIFGEREADLDVEVYDGDSTSSEALLFGNAPARSTSVSAAGLRSVRSINIGGRPWTLVMHSLPGLEARLGQQNPPAILAGGLLASLLLIALTLTLVTRNRGLNLRVAERTAELNASNRQLEVEVADRSRAEEAERLERTLYESIVERAPVMITRYDPSTNLLFLNREFKEISGWTSEDAARGNLLEKCYPDEAVRAQAVEFMGAAPSEWREFPFVTSDGRELRTSWTNVKLPDGTNVGIGLDLTDRLRAVDALRESEEKYRVIFNNELTAICIFDLETLRFLDVNPAYETVYGWSRDELIAREMTIHDITAEHQDSDAKTEQAKRGGTIFIPLRWHRKKDGTRFPVQIVGGPYMYRGKRVIFAMALDITARYHAEEVVRTSLREKETLLREIHHRVKNNMQVVSSLLDLQAQRLVDPVLKSVFLVAQHRVKTMALLHEKLYKTKELSKIDFADYLRDLAQEIMASHGVGAPRIACSVDAHGVRLELAEAVPCALMVSELLTNALKHAFPEPRNGEVVIDLREQPEGYVLSIRDDGVGLPAGFDLATCQSLGLQLVGVLAGQLRGTFALTNRNGVTALITFPAQQTPS
jgi:PAS domain S-box-containing protein